MEVPMTTAIGKRFGDRIVIASDTMISDPREGRPSIIPGRLKTLVLSSQVSVSYAGRVVQAVDAVKRAKDKLPSISTFLSDLKELTSGDMAEFLVASHIAGPQLLKVAHDRIYEGSNLYWIGDANAASEMSITLEKTPHIPPVMYQDGTFTSEEQKFRHAFLSFIEGRVSDVVGGIPILCLASPFGHTYDNYARAVFFGKLVLGPHLSPAEVAIQEAQRKSGQSEWKYTAIAPNRRGVALMGVYLEQPELGLLYSPFESDDAELFSGTTLDRFAAVVQERANRL
jgi:hypothetical protein